MKRIVSLLTIAAISSGCTTSSESFYKDKTKGDKTSICRAYLKTQDPAFRQDIEVELTRRGVSAFDCAAIVKAQNTAIAAGVAVALVGAVAVACANSSGGCRGGGGYSAGSDWDEFYNQYGQLVWACRDIGTGRFTYQYAWSGLPQTDYRWPAKYA
ncbi:MAG: hypothetical protein ACRECY_07275 [Phyllobacterium sp.]